MDWTYLGHAGWLARAGALRLLFDPILEDPHQAGTYGVWPPRRVNAEGLRPDFLFVSHAHADHFDVRSLARLARLDPDTVVVTPEPLVGEVARCVGFRVVRELGAGHAIELDGARIALTPSCATDPEWGVVVETPEASVWNQVDTVLSGPAEVARIVGSLGLRAGLDLALARWAPLLEIDAQVPGSLAFPFESYGDLLRQVAATGARHVVPSAAGQRHMGGARWLDPIFMPVTEERFRADLTALVPEMAALPPCVGGTYDVRQGTVALDPIGGRDLVSVETSPGPDPRAFLPLAVPGVVERAPLEDEPHLRRIIEGWLAERLPTSLAAAWPTMGLPDAARLGLEVVFPSGPERWTFVVERGACTRQRGLSPDLDVVDVVSAAGLADVLTARRAWGHVLLAGELRASQRGYRVDPRGLRRVSIASTFLYYALPYAESARRATLGELDAVLAGRPPPWQAPRGELSALQRPASRPEAGPP